VKAPLFPYRGLQVAAQGPAAITYRGVTIDVGYRLDLLVENCVVVELKAVARRLPIHDARLLSYLKLVRHRAGLLINFHVPHLRDGIKRLVN
jgi:GxxExxY protein